MQGKLAYALVAEKSDRQIAILLTLSMLLTAAIDFQPRQQGIQRCPDPSEAPLQEMRDRLQGTITSTSNSYLLRTIKQVATQLRQYNIWSYRESLETYDPEKVNYSPREDLPKNLSNEADDLEGRELLIFLQESLKIALNSAIAHASLH